MFVDRFAFIKPDAVANGNADEILTRIDREGFEILAQKQLTLTQAQAREFYAEHAGRDFFQPLIEFVTRSAVLLCCAA